MQLILPQGADKADLQVYTVADMDPDTGEGRWVKPSGAATVVVTCIGPGGAGGSGSCFDAGESGTVVGPGGGGGTGGAYTEITFAARVLPDVMGVYVDEAHVGGAGVTTGKGRTSPTRSVSKVAAVYDLDDFVSFAQALGGLCGVGGGDAAVTAADEPTAENARGGGLFTSASGGIGGGAGNAISVAGGPTSVRAPSSVSNGSSGPGGGGGGIGAGPTIGGGGWGGSVAVFGPYGQGSPGLLPIDADPQRLANPGVDAMPSVDRGIGVPGVGGSGGGASTTGNGGNGAHGGTWGGGGGGGGAARPGFTSGAGGDGGSGIVIITTYF